MAQLASPLSRLWLSKCFPLCSLIYESCFAQYWHAHIYPPLLPRGLLVHLCACVRARMCVRTCVRACISLLVVDFYLNQELLLQVVSDTEQAESHYHLLMNLFFLGFLVFWHLFYNDVPAFAPFCYRKCAWDWKFPVKIYFDFHITAFRTQGSSRAIIWTQ